MQARRLGGLVICGSGLAVLREMPRRITRTARAWRILPRGATGRLRSRLYARQRRPAEVVIGIQLEHFGRKNAGKFRDCREQFGREWLVLPAAKREHVVRGGKWAILSDITLLPSQGTKARLLESAQSRP